MQMRTFAFHYRSTVVVVVVVDVVITEHRQKDFFRSFEPRFVLFFATAAAAVAPLHSGKSPLLRKWRGLGSYYYVGSGGEWRVGQRQCDQ